MIAFDGLALDGLVVRKPDCPWPNLEPGELTCKLVLRDRFARAPLSPGSILHRPQRGSQLLRRDAVRFPSLKDSADIGQQLRSERIILGGLARAQFDQGTTHPVRPLAPDRIGYCQKRLSNILL